MKITWIGHSCFKIEKDGFSLVIDPYEDGSVPGLKPMREKANMVLCSHEHSDHNARASVETEEKSGFPFKIDVIDTYHDDVKGAQRGPSKIFIIDDGENRVAHLGDLGCDLEPSQKEKLMGLDAVMIPVGGFFTIDGEKAAEIVKELCPRIVIPMHYRDDAAGFGFDTIGTVEEFTKRCDSVSLIPASEIETTGQYPSQVMVLQPENI